MIDINKKDFNPGGLKDRFDNRDYHWTEVGFGSLPFNWSTVFDIEEEISKVMSIPSFKLTVKDQGGSGSCGGQAWAYLAEVLEAINTKTYEPRSAKYVYSQTYVPQGGSYGRDNADIFIKQGVSEESKLTSYENSQPPFEAFMRKSEDITYDIRENAKLSMSSSYVQTGIDINTVAQAIRDTGGVILGISGSNNGTWGSTMPIPPVAGDAIWRHWIYAGKVKTINGKKYIGCFNSWGNNVGDAGWQWISEDYFASPDAIFSGWTHVYSTNTPIVTPFKHTFVKQLDYGMTDPEVMWLQKALTLEGFFPKTVIPTNYFGNITKQSLQSFQIKYNIVSSGIPSTTGFGRVGPKTISKLNQLYA